MSTDYGPDCLGSRLSSTTPIAVTSRSFLIYMMVITTPASTSVGYKENYMSLCKSTSRKTP